MKRSKKKAKTSKRYSEKTRYRVVKNTNDSSNEAMKQWNSILFFLFLFFLPTQLGRHFFFPFSYLNGVRVDYLAPTVYLTDMIALLLIVMNFKTVTGFFRNKTVLVLLGLLLMNVLFSISPVVSAYRFLKIVEFLGVFAVARDLYEKANPKHILLAAAAGGLVQLFIAVSQLALGRSLQGPFYYLGERLMSLSTPGIAKAVIQGKEFLRPYGTFSHPNSLAGYFLLWFFTGLTLKKFDASPILKYLLLFVSASLILLSYSKTAILTFIILNSIFYIVNYKFKCRICRLSRILIPLAISPIFLQAVTDPLTIVKRLELVGDSLSILAGHALTGVGLGSYVIAQSGYASRYAFFFNQPVHNIFLLFISETGFLTGGLITVLLIKPARYFITHYPYIVLAIVLTGMLDHYWLTLQQNFLLAALVMGVCSNPLLPGSSGRKAARLIR